MCTSTTTNQNPICNPVRSGSSFYLLMPTTGDQFWYAVAEDGTCGPLHRLDGPAVIMNDGVQKWYQDGQLHRLDGPAYVGSDQHRWYRHGKLHRENAPAIITNNGFEYWWLNGVCQRICAPTRHW